MLPAPPRTASGRRIYGPAETGSLAFIRRSRELGFTLDGAAASTAEVLAWLREQAIQHYPDSEFANRSVGFGSLS